MHFNGPNASANIEGGNLILLPECDIIFARLSNYGSLRSNSEMKSRWIKRRAHPRKTKPGRVISVREAWVFCAGKSGKKHDSYRHECPHCGAKIISVHMPNGGWPHFEGGPALGKVKHPCLHRGEGLPKTRDEQTLEMFEDTEPKN